MLLVDNNKNGLIKEYNQLLSEMCLDEAPSVHFWFNGVVDEENSFKIELDYCRTLNIFTFRVSYDGMKDGNIALYDTGVININLNAEGTLGVSDELLVLNKLKAVITEYGLNHILDNDTIMYHVVGKVYLGGYDNIPVSYLGCMSTSTNMLLTDEMGKSYTPAIWLRDDICDIVMRMIKPL